RDDRPAGRTADLPGVLPRRQGAGHDRRRGPRPHLGPRGEEAAGVASARRRQRRGLRPGRPSPRHRQQQRHGLHLAPAALTGRPALDSTQPEDYLRCPVLSVARGAHMNASARGERAFDWLWLLVWGLASSVWCVTAACRLGATFDEPLYVQ